jgi:hypothetical protein
MFWYQPLTAFWRIWATILFLSGHRPGWGTIPRGAALAETPARCRAEQTLPGSAMVAGRQDSAATARDEWAESDRASAIACSSVTVEPAVFSRSLQRAAPGRGCRSGPAFGNVTRERIRASHRASPERRRALDTFSPFASVRRGATSLRRERPVLLQALRLPPLRSSVGECHPSRACDHRWS